MIRVRIENPAPAIPYRGCDWCAWPDHMAPDDCSVPLGWGATAHEALLDLMDEMGVVPVHVDLTATGARVEIKEMAA